MAIPFRIHPMLATLTAEPFDTAGWIYEEKYDGDRIVAYKDGKHVRLISRNGKDHTDRFPRIADAVARLKSRALILDGEAVVFDKKKVSRFQLVQNAQDKAAYAVFDCLYADGKDLRREPLSVRRAAMRKAIGRSASLFPSHVLARNGLDAYKQARRAGYEGLVAKKLASRYVEARSTEWLKVKVRREDEFVIVGYTRPEGAREFFGALLLGAHVKRELRYAGKVGTGFNRKTLAQLHRMFQPLVAVRAPVADPPRERGVTWLKPRLVAQISYQELTSDKRLRQPVYLGLRDDKRAQDVVLPVARR